MKPISPTDLETAFVIPDTPSFADIATMISEDESLSKTRQRDLLSGLRRVAKALEMAPETVPADPGWLQPRINAVAPAALGLTPKSWSNLVSDARAALAHTGIVKAPRNRPAHLHPDWRVLWERVLATKDRGMTATLHKFIYFLNAASVAPSEVRDEHLDAVRDALALNQIRRDPDVAHKHAFYAWNRAAEKIEGWPAQKLTRQSRQKRNKLPLTSYPESFATDLDLFWEKLARPDIFMEEIDCRPMRPGSISHYRRKIERFAGVLVRTGLPCDEITGLGVLIDPDAAERGLRWMYEDHGDLKPDLGDMAHTLCLVARRHVRVNQQVQKKLDTLATKLSLHKAPGMTAKNRERLRPLLQPAVRRRLLRLPDRLFEEAEAATGRKAYLLREEAVAIAILSICPIRRYNLVSIHLHKHLRRSEGGSAWLVFDRTEVKNRQDIEFELLPYVAKMIDGHLASRSPALCPAGTGWLFPRRDGTAAMDGDYLALRVTRRIEQALGLKVHLHLFRHLSAHVLLDAMPGNYEGARRLLGHSRLSTTLNAYTGSETTTASRLFANIIDAERGL